MYANMLKPVVNGVKGFLSSPAVKKSMINAARYIAMNPQTRREIEKGISSIAEYISAIRLKISFRVKESEFVIDATNKIQINCAKDIKNSNVIMGENIRVNQDITVNININMNDMKHLAELIEEIKALSLRLESVDNANESIIVKEYKIKNAENLAKNINAEVDSLSKEIKR